MNVERTQFIAFALGFSTLAFMHAQNTISSIWYLAVVLNSFAAVIFLSKFYPSEGIPQQRRVNKS